MGNDTYPPLGKIGLGHPPLVASNPFLLSMIFTINFLNSEIHFLSRIVN